MRFVGWGVNGGTTRLRERKPTSSTNSDPVERAKTGAATLYPEATVSTRCVRDKPVVLEREENIVRILRVDELDEQPSSRFV
jgi:hypothetical protein